MVLVDTTTSGELTVFNAAPADLVAVSDEDRLLAEILEVHAPAMYRVARSIVHDSSLAEDVVQESVMKAWRAIDSYRGDSSLRSWVLRITHNTAISMLRKRREDVRDPAVLPESSTSIDYASPEREIDAKLTVDQLWRALDQLDSTSRTIVVLREIEGMSYEDISETLELPLPTIKTRLFRARRQLATALTEWK
jgi:RNA polymerase sigma-70 factor, ECF subfamily